MNKYLRIENRGEIDPKAFLLIGASTKTNDSSKIGEFGSGANYAIAWLLRNQVDFSVYSGSRRIVFATSPEEFRGEKFERILVDGEPTSFTAAMGKDWLPWFVLREFWCNAIDEGEARKEVLESDPELLSDEDRIDRFGREGYTRIYIELRPDLLEVVDDWATYFSADRRDLVWEDPETGAKVYTGGPELVVYRKGIRVYHAKETACVFHYDLPSIRINESRTVAETWEMDWAIRGLLAKKIDRTTVRHLLRNIRNKYEAELSWSYEGSFSPAFKEVLEGKTVVEESLQEHYGSLVELNQSVVLPDGIAKKLVSSHQAEHVAGDMSEDGVVVIEPTEKERAMIAETIEWLTLTGYKVEAEVYLANFSRKGILGLAHAGKIFVSRAACESMRLCASTVIEEQEHLRTGLEDCTRAFQDHLIYLLIDAKQTAYNLQIQ